MRSCRHPETSFFRHVFRFGDGGEGFHVAEHCHACGANVRGQGVWVPKSEVLSRLLLDPAELPVWEGLAGDQPTLF